MVTPGSVASRRLPLTTHGVDSPIGEAWSFERRSVVGIPVDVRGSRLLNTSGTPRTRYLLNLWRPEGTGVSGSPPGRCSGTINGVISAAAKRHRLSTTHHSPSFPHRSWPSSSSL
jgi:hypothetical protein